MRALLFVLFAAATTSASRALDDAFFSSSTVLPRPGVYFGTRTLEPHPIITGIAWNKASASAEEETRHTCRHEHKLQKWGWTAYDGKHYGVETIGDKGNGVDFSIEWLRLPLTTDPSASLSHHLHDSPASLAHNGQCQAWLAIINGSETSSIASKRRQALLAMKEASESGKEPDPSIKVPAPRHVSFFAYLAAGDGVVEAVEAASSSSNSGRVTALVGRRDARGERFGLLVREGKGNVHPAHEPGMLTHFSTDDEVASVAKGADSSGGQATDALSRPHHLSLQLPADEVWRVDDVLKNELGRSRYQTQVRVQRARMAAVSSHPEGSSPLPHPRPVVVPVLNNTRLSEEPNLAIVQVLVTAPFKIELVFIHPDCFPEEAEEETEQDLGKAAERLVALADALGLGPAASEEDEGEAASNAGAAGAAAAAQRGTAHVRTTLRALYKQELCARLGLCDGTAAVGGAAATSNHSSLHLRVANAALANLLGSITYFHGQQLVGHSHEGATREEQAQPPVLSKPHGLLTGVPSRSFFPRGFLWDEGFHQLVVSQWDPSITRRVLASWLGTMDKQGWIAREQILGSEARSRVPEQFQVQRPDIANPPALLLPILTTTVRGLCGEEGGAGLKEEEVAVGADGSLSSSAAASLPTESSGDAALVRAFCARHRPPSTGSGCRYACTSSPVFPYSDALERQETLSFLRKWFPRLESFFAWFKRTQAGRKENTFRWRGASQDHNFASGLDDYPRGRVPHETDENVDLLAWMAMTAHILSDLAPLAGLPEVDGKAAGAPLQEGGGDGAAKGYAEEAARYTSLLLERHWDEEAKTFCDWGVKDAVPLPLKEKTPRQGQQFRFVHGRVCHTGYVSILPVLLRLVDPADPRLGKALEAMEDEKQLLSPYGLRSLSLASPHFGTKEDYWRGAVWINMNFLAVSSLRSFYGGDERAAKLAEEIRRRVVEGIAAEYKRSGFLWENYDSRDGHGRGTHPFTGWTALVALLIAEKHPF